jgi:hypothetical protein
VPANTSAATGTFEGSYDERSGLLGFKIVYAGLTANATSAHIHRGAIGANGPVQIDFAPLGFTFGAQSGTFSKLSLTALTASQVTDLLAGNLYVNIHSSSFPGGEIRAQLNATPPGVAPAPQEGKILVSELSTSIFPNPSSDYVFLNLGNNDVPVNVELFDMQGRLMSALKTSDTVVKWDATSLVNGLYFFRIQKGAQLEMHKWSKN